MLTTNNEHARPTGRGFVARLWTAIITAVLLVVGVIVPQAAAVAAGGPAVLDVSISPVDYATGDPQLDASFGAHGDRLAFRVNFSCAVEECVDATVQLSPSQADPYGLAALAPSLVPEKALLWYESWTAPAGVPGATIEGDNTTGKLVRLGTVPAGTSSSFLVVYSIAATGTYGSARAAQFYPNGFQIENTAVIDSTNSQAAVTADAAPVTWSNELPTPTSTIANPGTVQPDRNVVLSFNMSSGSFYPRSDGALMGTSKFVAAGYWEGVATLPPQAVYVSSNGSGVYDAATHTVTWRLGSEDAPAYFAAGGWDATRSPYGPRTVTVQYPSSAFPEADANGCNFEVPVYAALDVTLGYLDPARTVQTTRATMTHNVACFDEFGRGTSNKESSGSAGSATNRLVNVPAAGSAAASYIWSVFAYNSGNRPAVATIVDNDLGQADAKVYAVRAPAPGGTIDFTLNTGATGTAPLPYNVPAGTWLTAATVTSNPIQPVNTAPGDTGRARFYADFYYHVESDAPIGESRTNTANTTISYPDTAIAPIVTPQTSATITFRSIPTGTPNFNSVFAAPAAVEGGGNAVPGRNVTFSVTGTSANIPPEGAYAPEYVFIAPEGWVITDGSAAFAAGSVPDGVQFSYATKTIDGVARDVVVAKWPDGVTFGSNSTYPPMTVVAQPTSAVAAGTTSVATAWSGESTGQYTAANATFQRPVTNTADVADDGKTDQRFSTATQSILVSAADGVTVTKEICQVDPAAADGCNWISDPSIEVPVSTTATGVKYRITVTNTGNTTLNDIVAYDVLPYIGDVGTSQGASSSPRGSTFAETLDSVFDVSGNVDLAYSASTNPVRDEVYPGAPGAVDDWNTDASGKAAIRATIATLAGGQTATFSYNANIAAGATADAIACNSVALASDKTLPAEPQAVCATTREADLSVTVPDHLPLQVGRAGVLPVVVTNLGGSQSAPATATVTVPAGVTVTSLTPAGWVCATDPAATAPIVGPAVLECTPVDGSGDPTTIELGTPLALNLPVLATAVADSVCVTVAATGPLNDPVLSNDDADVCAEAVEMGDGVSIAKDDGVTAVTGGDELTYTIDVTNLLVGETLSGAVVTDTLPAELEFVSATAGGTAAGQTVTWNLADLAAAGVANADGDQESGAPGSTTQLTVTVRVLRNDADTIENTATVVAADPADAAAEFTESASDVDDVRRLSVTKSVDGPAVPRPGDTLEYSVVVTNDGAADYTDAVPATVTDDLTGVLDDAVFGDDAAASSGDAPVFTTPNLAWSGALAAGDSVTITYSVTVAANGDGHLVNSACVPEVQATDGTEACATTTTELPKLTVTKTADPLMVPAVGDDVTYTVTVSNTGLADYTDAAPATVTDDLAGVLDDADYNDDAAASAGAAPVYDDGGLSWSGALAAGDAVTITYTVTYTGAGDRELVNTACIPADEVAAGFTPCVTNSVSAAFIVSSKTADPASGTTVIAGQDVTYTVTLENIGTATGTVDTSDDASQVLDDATIAGAPVSSSPDVIVGAPVDGVYPITGTVDAGATVTITYTVTVLPFAQRGDSVLTNFLGTVPPSGTCATEAPASDTCTTNPVQHLSVEKTSDAGAETTTGSVVEYTVTVRNDGGTAFLDAAPATASDDLSDVLDDATYRGDVQASVGTATITDGQLAWSGPLAAGASATITYSVLVTNAGDHQLVNTASVENAGDLPVTATVTTPLSDIHVNKTADPVPGPVSTGDTIAYTIELRNDGTGAGAVARTDDLSGVLDDASIVDAPVSSDPSITVTGISDDGFGISGTLASGATVTVTYSVLVLPFADRGDSIIVNRIVEPSVERAAARAAAPVCPPVAPGEDVLCTEHTIAHASVTKTSDVTANLSIGDVVTYTVGVTNDGTADFTTGTPAAVTDELSDVLDDATWQDDAVASDGGPVTLTGTELAWSGAIPAGETVTLTYSVLVTGAGDEALRNIASVSNVGEADVLSASTVGLITDITAEKTADVPNGTTVKTGQQVTYTLTFRNAGAGDGELAYTDDLTRVLDDATVTAGPSATGTAQASIVDGAVVVTGPLAAGATATVSYTVTVKAYAEQGDHRLFNAVTQTGIAPPAECVLPGTDGDPQTCTYHLISADELASTGVNGVAALIGGAGVLLLGGLVLVIVRRKRRDEETTTA